MMGKIGKIWEIVPVDAPRVLSCSGCIYETDKDCDKRGEYGMSMCDTTRILILKECDTAIQLVGVTTTLCHGCHYWSESDGCTTVQECGTSSQYRRVVLP